MKLTVLFLLSPAVYAWTSVCNTPLTSDQVISVEAVMGKPSCEEIGVITANDPSIVSNFCFHGEGSFSLNTSSPWLFQRLQFVPVRFSTNGDSYFPDSVRIEGALGSGEPVWYRNSSSFVWSQVPLRGDLVDISSDGLEADKLRMFLHSTQTDLKFGLRIFGCPLRETSIIEFKFNSSSLNSIELNYGTVGLFQDKLLATVNQATDVDVGRLHMHIVAWNDGVVAEVRVLPDSGPGAERVEDIASKR